MAYELPEWVNIIAKLSGPVTTLGALLLGSLLGVARDKRRLRALEQKVKKQDTRIRRNTTTLTAHTDLLERFSEAEQRSAEINQETKECLAELNRTVGTLSGQIETAIRYRLSDGK